MIRDEIELKILDWLEKPGAELEPIMELEMTASITPEAFAGSPIEEAYLRTAPNPDDFPNLVTKLKQLDMEPFAWPPEDIRGSPRPSCSSSGIPMPSASGTQ